MNLKLFFVKLTISAFKGAGQLSTYIGDTASAIWAYLRRSRAEEAIDATGGGRAEGGGAWAWMKRIAGGIRQVIRHLREEDLPKDGELSVLDGLRIGGVLTAGVFLLALGVVGTENSGIALAITLAVLVTFLVWEGKEERSTLEASAVLLGAGAVLVPVGALILLL